MNDLNEVFHSRFELLDADTPDLLDMVYAVRYQVYCLETGFEDKSRFPDGRESDPFDAHALHGLLVTQKTRRPFGTIRLVLPGPSLTAPRFPLEQAYPDLLASHGYGPDKLASASMAEISRFAISKEFKRRLGEASSITGVTDESLRAERAAPVNDRRHFPHIILGLFRSLCRLSAQAGLTHWVAVMEAPFLRLIDRFGFKFEPLGEPVEFHGLRQPCVGRIDAMLARIYTKRRDVWEFMTDGGRIWSPPESGIMGTAYSEPEGRNNLRK